MKRVLPLMLLMLAGADAPQLSDAYAKELWRVHWPRYASLYVTLGDSFAPCAKYDRRYPSSRQRTADKVQSETRRTVSVPVGGTIMRRNSTKQIPKEDAEQFSKAIPQLKVGEYGYIAQAKIEEVISPTEVIVEEVKLIDATALEEAMAKVRKDLARRSTARNDRRAVETQTEYRFQKRLELLETQDERDFQKERLKLVGFDFAGFEKGMTWPGPSTNRKDEGVQIAIVKTEIEEPKSGRRSRRRSRTPKEIMVAVPGERFQFRELSEEQFKQVLSRRGFDERKFVELVIEQKKARGETADEWIIRVLEQSRPDPAATTQPLDEDKRD